MGEGDKRLALYVGVFCEFLARYVPESDKAARTKAANAIVLDILRDHEFDIEIVRGLTARELLLVPNLGPRMVKMITLAIERYEEELRKRSIEIARAALQRTTMGYIPHSKPPHG